MEFVSCATLWLERQRVMAICWGLCPGSCFLFVGAKTVIVQHWSCICPWKGQFWWVGSCLFFDDS